MNEISRPEGPYRAHEAPPISFREAFDIGRALTTGIVAFRRAFVPLWLGALIMVVTEGSGCNLPNPGDFQGMGEESGGGATWGNVLGQPFGGTGGLDGSVLPWLIGISLAFLVCILVLVVLFLLVRAYIHPGYIRLHHHVLQTAEPSFKPLFSGADRFVPMLLWKLLSGAILFLSFILPALPGGFMLALTAQSSDPDPLRIAGAIALMATLAVPVFAYVALGLSLGAHAVTLEERTPIDALKRSWSLVSGHRWWLLLFFTVLLLFELAGLLGIILCCVGVLFTYPMTRSIADVGLTESFLLLTRGREVESFWSLRDLEHGAWPGRPPSAPTNAAEPGPTQ